MEFFRMGGFPMFVILTFGVIGVVNAGRYAWAPGPARLPYLGALGGILGIAGGAGFAVDLMTVCTRVPSNPEWANSPEVGMILVQGLGESLAPVVFASGFLLAQGLLVALGLRRSADA